MKFQALSVAFRKRCCSKNRGKRTNMPNSHPVIEEDGYAEYKINSEGESYTQLKVPTQAQLVRGENNPEGETSAQRVDGKENGAGMTDGDYAYAYAHMPNRGTKITVSENKEENTSGQYVNSHVLRK